MTEPHHLFVGAGSVTRDASLAPRVATGSRTTSRAASFKTRVSGRYRRNQRRSVGYAPGSDWLDLAPSPQTDPLPPRHTDRQSSGAMLEFLFLPERL